MSAALARPSSRDGRPPAFDNGCIPDGADTEILDANLAGPGKCFPQARITLQPLNNGEWQWGHSYAMPNHGGGCCAWAKPAGLNFPTRQAALEAAVSFYRLKLERDDSSAARAALSWLDTLNPDQMSFLCL